MFKIILIGLALTIGGIFVMSKIDQSGKGATGDGGLVTSLSGKEVKVVITGQILHPGEYIILPTETLGDLITKAGGAAEAADPDSYNSGLLIGSYTEFYIPSKSKTPDACIVETVDKHSVNSASVEQLKKVGLTSAQAAALIEYRAAHGEFMALEDIKLVSGIGDKTYLAVRDYLTLK